ncbi:MAG TPA: type II toxin-antitoxin system Phd/YefM family antitoxin [Anaerolineae bacterium]|nr:type II toxin-antitoxin system Phd/YefM family antitoxin [Anaerolineae bacterium]HQH37279.1 type II toxin-antitoxin system Phd/YefM family antitoxin [Anaerolineae bacterium]
MTEIGVRDLKTKASEIVRTVREERAHYVITHRGHPVALLMPLAEPTLEETIDIQRAQSVWDELTELGEEIGRAWQSPKTGVELLSEMRR